MGCVCEYEEIKTGRVARADAETSLRVVLNMRVDGGTQRSQRQLRLNSDLIADNNKFNNYYKHIQEFTAQFKEHPLIQTWKIMSRGDAQKELLLLYREFYYTHPLDFEPRMNQEMRALIEQFVKELTISKLNSGGYDIESPDEDKFPTLMLRHRDPLRRMITLINSKQSQTLRARLQEKGVPEANWDGLRTKFVDLNTTYWSHLFFLSLLAFDGTETHDFTQVSVNYEISRVKLSV